jgi:hypothetical protein
VRIVVFVAESGRQAQRRVGTVYIAGTARLEVVLGCSLDGGDGCCCSRRCSRRNRIDSYSSIRGRSRGSGRDTIRWIWLSLLRRRCRLSLAIWEGTSQQPVDGYRRGRKGRRTCSMPLSCTDPIRKRCF